MTGQQAAIASAMANHLLNRQVAIAHFRFHDMISHEMMEAYDIVIRIRARLSGAVRIRMAIWQGVGSPGEHYQADNCGSMT
jgi:hypothetical protein